MMFATVDNRRQLARPNTLARCPSCDGTVLAKCGEIRIWHWAHEADDCDAWAESESEWQLGWKKHAPEDRTEVVIEHDEKKHRADVLCLNSAVLELQDAPITAGEIRAREDFYKHMAWLFRVTWSERLHYGKKGFWWKHGQVAQTAITKPLFWHYEEENIVQEVKLARVDNTDRYGRVCGDRVVGRAVKTYPQAKFAEFIATGRMA